MLFNFQTFVQELKENPEKKELAEKYEKLIGPIEGNIQDQIWYSEYVSNFPTLTYAVPQELADDFDWQLLMQLVGASFSSDGMIEHNEDALPDFVISVQSGDQVVVKKISELRGFQVLRLYEIYAEEQMNLQVLIAEDEKEREAIESQRDSRAKRWNLVLENLEKDNLKQQDQAEREEKLDDLMGQL